MGEAIFLMAKLFPVLGSLLIGFVGVGVNCYIAHRDLDRILSNFKNSSVINYYGAMFQSKSFFSRCILASIVSGGVTWPGRSIRKGTLDAGELDRLPAFLKFRMKLSIALMFFGYAWLAIVVAVAEILNDGR
jgi:hypothetical protein